jgi:hypothetical protein
MHAARRRLCDVQRLQYQRVPPGRQTGPRRGWPPAPRPTGRDSQSIGRAPDAKRPPVEHVRIHHRRAHVSVTEQFLDCPNVVAILEQVRRERMATGVGTHPLRDAGLPRRARDGLLDNRLVKVRA